MIRRVMIFGCSYMQGMELPYHDSSLKLRLLEALHYPELDATGTYKKAITRDLFDKIDRMDKSIPGYMDLCQAQSLGGTVAKKLGVPYSNLARAGHSNSAVLADIINCLADIDQHTLVLVGMTWPSRETRLSEQDPFGNIVCRNNYNDVAVSSQHNLYIELRSEFGDDTLSRYLQAMNHLCTIGELLKHIPHVVIDPVNIYRSSQDISHPIMPWQDLSRPMASLLEDLHEPLVQPRVLECMQRYFDNNLFPHTLNHAMVAIRDRGQPCRELGGHPNKASHDWFVDQCLWPWLTDRGIVA
jgi:hypothetical protein